MPDYPSKIAWEKENIVEVKVKVNRNQDPELFSMISAAESRSGAARELMREALEARKKA